jgi:hypothetical protein
MKKIAVLLILLFVLIGCAAPGAEPGASEPTAEPTPEPTQELEPTLDPSDPLLQDAQAYADAQGIELEEALARLDAQQALDESGLQQALEENEAETFAGLWLQNEPEFRIVVAFTENGEQTIAPYLESFPYADLVEVRTHQYSLAELRAAQQETHSMMQELGVAANSGIQVQDNQVYLEIGNPDLLREELEAAGMELPEQVTVRAMGLEQPPDTLHPTTETATGPDGQTIYLPKNAPTNAGMDALIQGTLRLDENGCLRLEAGPEDEEAVLVIWPYDFSLRVEGDTVEVLNGAGEVVGRVDQELSMGGGHVSTTEIPDLPSDLCPGPYWITGDTQPLENVSPS